MSAACIARAQDGKAIIQKMMAAYQGLNSYVGRANADQRILAGGNRTVQDLASSVLMSYKKPDRLKLEFSGTGGERLFVSDGNSLIYYDNGPRTYIRAASGPDLKSLQIELRKLGVTSVFDPLYFLSNTTLPNNVTGLTFKDSEKVNGNAVYKVGAQINSPAQVFTASNGKKITIPARTAYLTWWIDKKTYLLARVEIRTPHIAQNYITMEQNRRVQKTMEVTYLLTLTVVSATPNPPLDDKVFAFVAPAGAKEVKSALQSPAGK